MIQLLTRSATRWLTKVLLIIGLLPLPYAMAEQDLPKSLDTEKKVAPIEAAKSKDSISKNATSDQTVTPISIEADSAEQNEKLGITVYSGNVSITQGELSIQANQVKITSVENDDTQKRTIENIIANGDPAIFSHNTENPAEQMVAKANTINYLLKPGVVTFEENAFLSQQGSSVRGNHIEYTIAERRIKAHANPENKKTRVKTIITPGDDLLFSTPEILR